MPRHLFIGADYSQMEIRLLAVAANDERLINFFNTGSKDEDIFKFLASQWLGKTTITPEERQVTKRTTYACAYGTGIGPCL